MADKEKNSLLVGEELNKYLDGLRDAGMEVTQRFHEIWRTAMMYVWNEQLDNGRDKPDWDFIVANYIHPLMMQGIAKLSKNNPRILGRPFSDQNADYAEIWQGIIQYIWEQTLDMKTKLPKVLLDAAIFGYSVGKVLWKDKQYYEGQGRWSGEVGFKIIHPAEFWTDPSADEIRECRSLGTYRKVLLDWAIAKWPDREADIRKEAADQAANGTKVFEFMGGDMVYRSQTAGTAGKKWYSGLVSLLMGGNTSTGTENEPEYVWLEEIYFVDDYEKHVKVEDVIPVNELTKSGKVQIEEGTGRVLWTETGEPIQQEEYPKQTLQEYDEPMFPSGRFVIRIGNTILNPKPEEQVYEYSRWPFVLMVHHMLPHMIQGANCVEFSRHSQDLLNSTISHLVEHVRKNSNPVKVIESQTLAKRRKGGRIQRITGAAGEILFARKGRKDAIRTLEASPIGQEVFSLIQLLRKNIETEQFMSETAQGFSPRGGVSATEAARLDVNAHDMTGFRSKLLDSFVEGTAGLIGEIAQKNYDIDRKLRIVGTDGDKKNILLSQELKEVQFDLEIEPGSTLPFDEERRKNDYMMVYKILESPIPNPMLEDMMRVFSIANRNKILAKHAGVQLFKQFVMLGQQIQVIQQQVQQQTTTTQQQAVGEGPTKDDAGSIVEQAGEKMKMQQQAAVAQQQIIQMALQLLTQVRQLNIPAQGAA